MSKIKEYTNTYVQELRNGCRVVYEQMKNTNTTSGTYVNLDFRANNADARIAYKYNGTANDGDFHFITDNTNAPETQMIIKNVLTFVGKTSTLCVYYERGIK